MSVKLPGLNPQYHQRKRKKEKDKRQTGRQTDSLVNMLNFSISNLLHVTCPPDPFIFQMTISSFYMDE